jgi:hypothetical protein
MYPPIHALLKNLLIAAKSAITIAPKLLARPVRKSWLLLRELKGTNAGIWLTCLFASGSFLLQVYRARHPEFTLRRGSVLEPGNEETMWQYGQWPDDAEMLTLEEAAAIRGVEPGVLLTSILLGELHPGYRKRRVWRYYLPQDFTIEVKRAPTPITP